MYLDMEGLPEMSTLRLILTRHAKSSWDDPNMTDHARPLNARGRQAADRIGGWLASRGENPQEVLCSDAERTKETWARIATHLPQAPEAVLKSSLYQAGPDVMMAVLRSASAPQVMMIGHNPGIAEFAARLVRTAPVEPEFRRYPSGATLIVTFDVPNWSELRFGEGSVADFTTPRFLE